MYYRTVACFVSGGYNLAGFLFGGSGEDKMALLLAPLKHWNGVWLVVFSMVLIGAKTLALRFADNPAYVVAMLLLSPMFAEVIQTRRVEITPAAGLVILFLGLLLLFAV